MRKHTPTQTSFFGATVIEPSPMSLDDELRRRFPGFTPSSYQQAIFQFLREGAGDGIVNAVAGSGKSTTLLYAAQLVPDDVLFVAFNAHIAKALGQRITNRHHTARTLHSIGHGCLIAHRKRLPFIDRAKYRSLCWKVVTEQVVPQAGLLQRQAVNHLLELVDFTRLTLTEAYEPDALMLLVEHFGLDIDKDILPLLLEAVAPVISLGAKRYEQQGVIDYTDQIYLPHLYCLEPVKVPWVFVDEAQDLNAAQLELAMKCRAPGGRMLFVGDVHQSIYGFSGADSESLAHIRQQTQATDLALSISYRCPTSVITLAQAIVPQIEVAPNAQTGLVAEVKRLEVPRLVQAGDLVLCRKMAPLVDLCINLIEQRVPATVRGRDLSHALTDIVHDVEDLPDYTDFSEFGYWLVQYEARLARKLAQGGGNEERIQHLQDRCRAVSACHHAFHVDTTQQLCEQIAGLFSDERSAVYLSTAHRAKGLEAERVFLLEPENFPLVWEKQQVWEFQQEMNLKYVALTRSLHTLYFIR